jgi:hypothetical protein
VVAETLGDLEVGGVVVVIIVGHKQRLVGRTQC